MSRKLILLHIASCCLLPGVLAGCTLDSADLQRVHDDYYCGDSRVDDDIGEWCEGNSFYADVTCALYGFTAGTLACTYDCQIDFSGCTGKAVCGDTVAEANEVCDGDDLRGATCESLGYVGGTLACRDCHLDESDCEPPDLCGNGIINPNEECDGDNIGANDCRVIGFAGELACRDNCTFDLSGCYPPVCGNGVVEVDEGCDDGETDECAGTCNADCTAPKNVCGDNIARCGEPCEEIDLQGRDCTDFGFAAPAGLACLLCAYDTSGCHD
jgi:hypothetical protein